MSGIVEQGTAAAARLALKPRISPEMNARTSVAGFAVLTAQLMLLLAAFRVFHLEEPAFFVLSAIAFGGFALHYWLPFAAKEWFWIALSLAAAFVLLQAATAALLIAFGLLIFAIACSSFSFRVRAGAIAALFAGLMAARAFGGPAVPAQLFPVLGSIFMFRLIVYVYDLRFARSTPSIREFLSYFFLLPNYYFLLFPVIDFQTLRKSYYIRDIHIVAQQGIHWMVRGTVQLLLYRLIYHFKTPATPDAVTSFASLVWAMLLTYLLYLKVSGTFHIIIGILHLFGYDLPETHRQYLLARSLTDFWRRINIYWKDFMVKVFYFPVYFKLRRSGEVRAQIAATCVVFAATWALHSYQFFWLRGEVLLTWPDALFWAILGGCVVVNLLIELRSKRTPKPTGWWGRLVEAGQTGAIFAFIAALWSFWHAPSVSQWIDLLTWSAVG